MSKVAYELDGEVHVVHSVDGHENAVAKAIPAGARNVITVADLPDERIDRHLWMIESGRIIVRGQAAPPPLPPPVYTDDPIPEFLTKTEDPAPPVVETQIPPMPDWSLKDLMAAAEEEPHQQPSPAPAEVAPPTLAPEIPPAAAADHYEPLFVGEMNIPPPPPISSTKMQEEPRPEPEPVPSIVETVRQVVMPTWAREKLPEMPVVEITDAERRKAAEQIIAKAMSGLAIITPEQSIRYEVALQARNGSVPHKMMLEDEATEAGAGMEAFCDRIIMERTLQEQRIMRAYAIKARTLRTILDMEGMAIDEAAEVAAQEIREV